MQGAMDQDRQKLTLIGTWTGSEIPEIGIECEVTRRANKTDQLSG